MLKEDGRQGFDTATAIQFDVVIADIQRPHKSKFEFAKALLAEFGLQLPIIALTAHINLLQEDPRSKLFSAYLAKPVAPTALLTTLQE
ncbi:response regulator [Andreprevotia chitinilytica]|uniref:response regulator n=1 Tax=Andreprevotia chitinilytica TaxID=396808 RepID=UPI0005525EDA|nr:response regulator [Andreprevotia chitinilytica]